MLNELHSPALSLLAGEPVGTLVDGLAGCVRGQISESKMRALSNTEFFLNVIGVMDRMPSLMYITATLFEHCAQDACTVKD